jgi:hypothetical protein
MLPAETPAGCWRLRAGQKGLPGRRDAPPLLLAMMRPLPASTCPPLRCCPLEKRVPLPPLLPAAESKDAEAAQLSSDEAAAEAGSNHASASLEGVKPSPTNLLASRS